jgi:hypothetical protein
MAVPSPQLIVREPMPWRQRLLLAALGLTMLVGFFGAFEYGRSSSSYDFWGAVVERRELNARIETLESENKELRGKLAAAETERLSLNRERAEVSRNIGELQAQVSRQEQQLAFYKGIVSQGANPAEVRIQRIRVEPGAGPGRFRLKIALVRPVQNESLVSGTAQVQVDGQQKGLPVRLELRQITDPETASLQYSFRYVENLDTDLTLPVDFRPERVTVELRSSKKGADPLVQTQVWDAGTT